ncbi:Uncharacterised protein [Bifidobacterium longum subsp. infantis]|nr:Uncharacterised protein [Bifidobacterium longum subsp. infantis]
MSGQSKHLFSTDPIIMQFNNLLGELVNSLKRVTNLITQRFIIIQTLRYVISQRHHAD